MIDFDLSAKDREVLDQLRQEALVARRYARYYDENEHEFPPSELPEAAQFPSIFHAMAGRTSEDSGMGVISMLITAAQAWGDYSVRIRQPKGGGLGNAALRAAGTPEQVAKWQGLTLAMAITEPGCGSDPSRVQTTAVLDGDEWVINGEKIFVTTGCRAEGVVVWATIDKSAGRGGIKSFLIEKGTPGFVVAHKEKNEPRDDTAADAAMVDAGASRAPSPIRKSSSTPRADSAWHRTTASAWKTPPPAWTAFSRRGWPRWRWAIRPPWRTRMCCYRTSPRSTLLSTQHNGEPARRRGVASSHTRLVGS
jgi:hypothetical protein